jgi:hypothetical protein
MQTDRHEEGNSPFLQFCERTYNGLEPTGYLNTSFFVERPVALSLSILAGVYSDRLINRLNS